MKAGECEEGQMLVITAFCLVAIMGFMALAIDVGLLFRAQRQIQIAADAAATAGAIDYYYNGVTNVSNVAKRAAGDNGFTDGTDGVAVTVNTGNAITSAAHTGPGYVEVIASRPTPTIFLQVFRTLVGASPIPMTVSARAEAGAPGGSDYCAYILDGTASGALSLQGSFDVSAPSCGVVVNSNSSSAISFTGNGGQLSAGSIGVVGAGGGTGVSGMHPGESIPPPVTGIVPVLDPLAGVVTAPNPSGLSCTNPSGSLTGIIDGGGNTVCYSGNVTLDNVSLQNGTFVFTGNVTFKNNVSTGTGAINTPGTNGATIDIASGSLSIGTPKANFLFNLHAPQSGPYSGIALMAGATNHNILELDSGSSCGGIYGIVYTPAATLALNDSGCDKNGGLSLTTDLIVGKLDDKTATLRLNSWSKANPGGTPLKKIVLVE